ERAVVDVPAVSVFLDEQCRDQEPAEHEEDVDTQKTTRRELGAAVVQHHGDHGERADAIERGPVEAPLAGHDRRGIHALARHRTDRVVTPALANAALDCSTTNSP